MRRWIGKRLRIDDAVNWKGGTVALFQRLEQIVPSRLTREYLDDMAVEIDQTADGLCFEILRAAESGELPAGTQKPTQIGNPEDSEHLERYSAELDTTDLPDLVIPDRLRRVLHSEIVEFDPATLPRRLPKLILDDGFLAMIDDE